MKTTAKLAVTLALGLAVGGCDDIGTGIALQDLQGTWDAMTYTFAENSAPSNRVDIIQRDGASFRLTVETDGTASTLFDDGLGGTSSDSGDLNGTHTTLTLDGATYVAVRNGDLLSLTDASASFDFGSGSVPATRVIVLERQ